MCLSITIGNSNIKNIYTEKTDALPSVLPYLFAFWVLTQIGQLACCVCVRCCFKSTKRELHLATCPITCQFD